MMSFFSFAIELYFAMMLGVSGIDKLYHAHQFQLVLYQQRMLPLRSISWIRRIFPWIEITVALCLSIGIAQMFVAILTLTLFLLFLGIKLFLFGTKSQADCGCHIRKHTKPVDGSSLVVSTLLVILATFYLGLVMLVPSVAQWWRIIGSIPLIAGGGFLLLGVLVGRLRLWLLPTTAQTAEVGTQAPLFFSQDQDGNTITIQDF